MHILITTGPTREYIDPVRYISNDSSGLMGIALADTAMRHGFRITLISGPITLRKGVGLLSIPKLRKSIRYISVISAREMFAAVKKYYKRADVIICAAAVADFRSAKFCRTKIKKDHPHPSPSPIKGEGITLRLVRNPDILKWLGAHKRPGQILVGFALETENLLKNASKKLREKKCDLIVANKSSAIGATKSSAFIINRTGIVADTKQKTKTALAKLILEMIKPDLKVGTAY